jgi:ABC-type multidrug transport system ATPase subunit
MQDPTNGLEPKYAARLLNYITNLSNTTCIISSSDELITKHTAFQQYLLINGQLEKKH